jgi:hypothetical protein
MPRSRSTLGPTERDVLLRALDPRAELRDASDVALDWPALIGAARAINMLPALADRALVSGRASLDAETAALLRDALQETAVYNARLLAELARCVSTLQAAGIPSVALKGVVLLARHYPRPSMRHTVDLDVLVGPARFRDAVACLRAAGYSDDPYHATTLVGDGRTIAAAWPENHHTCPPLKGPSGATLDLHHEVPATFYAASGGFTGLLARSKPVSVQGVTIQMCGAADLAMHLCEHFALQHYADPTDAAKLLCDLRAMFPGTPPWGELPAVTWRQHACLALVRALYDAVFCAATDPLSRALRRSALADVPGIALLSELSHLRGHAARLSFNVLYRPGYALRSVVPTRAYMAQHHRIDPNSPWIYPLYATRLCTTLLKPLWPRA